MAKRLGKQNVRRGEIPAGVPAASHLPLWFQGDLLWGTILILAVALTFSPVGWAGYIWDDDTHLTANPCIIGPLGLKEIWTTSEAQQFPLVLTMFWAEHALWGLQPLPYHLTTVLFHGACGLVLWHVLRNLQVPGAWFGAVLWALHPVQVESVAWVAELKNTQSGLFYLLSILFFLKWVKGPHTRSGVDSNYGWSLLFAVLAMASKSSTVILPVVLCLSAWWAEGRWKWQNPARVFPFLLMSIAASAVTLWTVGQQLETGSPVRTWPERLVTAGDAVWFYLGKLLWPHPLDTIYPRWEIHAGVWTSYLPLLAAIAVFVVLYLYRDTWARPWFFAFVYFLTALLPVLGLSDQYILRYSFVFDHFQYLASMGPLALAGAGLVRLGDFILPRRYSLQAALSTGLLVLLGLLSWQRAWAYQSEDVLWTDELAKNPNCWVARNYLGQVFFKKGRVEEAIDQYQKALALNPSYDAAHISLGNAFSRTGDFDKAISQFQMALAINPDNDRACNDLGVVFAKKGQPDEAIAQFQTAVKINPVYAHAYRNLGLAYAQKGRLDEAISAYRKALAIDPHYAEAHNDLGGALLAMGQAEKAITEFQEVIRLDPNNTLARTNLAKALAIAQQTAGPQ